MKFKTTEKAIKQSYPHIIKVGYCRLQTLLSHYEPITYTCNRDGWKADIYSINGTAIATGYVPFGNITPSYEMTEKYEKKAQEIEYGTLSWSEKTEQLESLVNEFISEVVNS